MIPGCVTPGQLHRLDPSGPPNPATGRLACSAGEAARLTGLSGDLLDNQIRRGDLTSNEAGRRRLITRRTRQKFPGHPAQNTASACAPATDSPAGHSERAPEAIAARPVPGPSHRTRHRRSRRTRQPPRASSPPGRNHRPSPGSWSASSTPARSLRHSRQKLRRHAATGGIAMFAVTAHADEREAHVRDVERYGQNLPDGSRPFAHRRPPGSGPPAASHQNVAGRQLRIL